MKDCKDRDYGCKFDCSCDCPAISFEAQPELFIERLAMQKYACFYRNDRAGIDILKIKSEVLKNTVMSWMRYRPDNILVYSKFSKDFQMMLFPIFKEKFGVKTQSLMQAS